METTVHPCGFSGPAALCDEYYSWNATPSGKVRGFVFWFDDCFQLPLYFVPMEEPYGSTELSLQDALEAWIDYLFEQKSPDIIGGGYEGSQSLADFAREQDLDPDTEAGQEATLELVTFGASYYAIASEGWQCKETWIKADGIAGAESLREQVSGRIDLLLDRLQVSHPAHYEQLMARPFQPENYSLTAAQALHTELTELLQEERSTLGPR